MLNIASSFFFEKLTKPGLRYMEKAQLTYRERLTRFINNREKAFKIQAKRLRNNMSVLERTWDNLKWARFIITFEKEILVLLPSEESRFKKQRQAILNMIEEAKGLYNLSIN